MSKSSVAAIATVAGLAAMLWLGHRAQQTARAQELADQARALLQVGLEKAPTLADLRATEARRLSEAALALAPSTRTRELGHAARAIELFSRGDLAGAERSRKLVGQALSELPALRVLDVRLLEARGEHALARAAAESALQEHRDDARVVLMAAELARADGRTDAALGWLDRAIASHPRAAALHEQRGLTQELLSNTAGARADYERAAAADRNAVTPLLQLGRLLRDVGQPNEALLAFRSALHRDPSNLDARMGLGVCRNELGDRVGARMEFEEAYAQDPNLVQPHLALGDLDTAEGHTDSALLHYRRAVQLDKHDAAAWLKLGNALMRANAAEQAAMAYQTAIKLAPNLAAAHNGLGAAMVAAGDAAAAESALAAAAKLDEADPNPLLNLAVLRRHHGDERGAREAIEQAQARDPNVMLASLTAPARRRASAERRP